MNMKEDRFLIVSAETWLLEAEGLVVTGVWASRSPSVPSPSPSGSVRSPKQDETTVNQWNMLWFHPAITCIGRKKN